MSRDLTSLIQSLQVKGKCIAEPAADYALNTHFLRKTLKADIAEQNPHIFCIELGRMLAQDDVRVDEQLKIATRTFIFPCSSLKSLVFRHFVNSCN